MSEKDSEVSPPKDKSRAGCAWAVVVILIVLGGAFIYGYYRLTSLTEDAKEAAHKAVLLQERLDRCEERAARDPEKARLSQEVLHLNAELRKRVKAVDDLNTFGRQN